MQIQTCAKHFYLPLLFLGTALNAQEYNTKIEGRIYSKEGDVAAIHISNITKNRGTITDTDGFFNISVALNDTLVFSAVHFKKKQVIVTLETLETKKLDVILEDVLTELKEVIVMPYNLSGELGRDMVKLKTGPIITSSTENLPNAYFKSPTQTERKLFAATDWDCNCVGVKLDPLINYFSNRTKMLNERIAREERTDLIIRVRKYYSDSLYIKDLKIPKKNIDDFVYFFETDSVFSEMIDFQDKLKLWEFMKKRSAIYRKNNKLD